MITARRGRTDRCGKRHPDVDGLCAHRSPAHLEAKEQSWAAMGYAAVRWVLRQFLTLSFGLKVTGEDHVPARGPVIIAANHASQMDPLVLAAALPRRVTFLAAAELLMMPVLGPLVRPFHPVPIKRGRFDRHAIKECLEHLGRGEALVIFPEGKISIDGRLQPPHEGLAFLAFHAGVPVIPMGLNGTYQVWPTGTRVPHHGKIVVQIGKPIMPEGAPTRENEAVLTARLMEAIAGLAGEPLPRAAPHIRPGGNCRGADLAQAL